MEVVREDRDEGGIVVAGGLVEVVGVVVVGGGFGFEQDDGRFIGILWGGHYV